MTRRDLYIAAIRRGLSQSDAAEYANRNEFAPSFDELDNLDTQRQRILTLLCQAYEIDQ